MVPISIGSVCLQGYGHDVRILAERNTLRLASFTEVALVGLTQVRIHVDHTKWTCLDAIAAAVALVCINVDHTSFGEDGAFQARVEALVASRLCAGVASDLACRRVDLYAETGG